MRCSAQRRFVASSLPQCKWMMVARCAAAATDVDDDDDDDSVGPYDQILRFFARLRRTCECDARVKPSCLCVYVAIQLYVHGDTFHLLITVVFGCDQMRRAQVNTKYNENEQNIYREVSCANKKTAAAHRLRAYFRSHKTHSSLVIEIHPYFWMADDDDLHHHGVRHLVCRICLAALISQPRRLCARLTDFYLKHKVLCCVESNRPTS